MIIHHNIPGCITFLDNPGDAHEGGLGVLSACDNLVEQSEINSSISHFQMHPLSRPA